MFVLFCFLVFLDGLFYQLLMGDQSVIHSLSCQIAPCSFVSLREKQLVIVNLPLDFFLSFCTYFYWDDVGFIWVQVATE